MYRGVTSRSYYADSRRQVQHRSLSPADIFKWAAILAPILLFFPPLRPPTSTHTHTPDALLLPFDFYFPFLSFFPPPSTSSVLRRGEPRVRRASPLFRHAREPLISADFARRVDPWNPCSCLSPAPARAGTSFHPSFLLALSFSPSAPSSSSSSLHSLSFAFVSTRRSRRKVFRRYRPLFQESGKRISFSFFFFIYIRRSWDIVYWV